jgi:NAD(P)-dependent dehydrogenase (short-subunit alcohol dehydrogenase family)
LKIAGSVALVTGANRGLGRAFARELVERGASTVYAGARNPDTVTDPGVVPVKLDITEPDDVRAVAERCSDLVLLVNNAGTIHPNTFLGSSDLDGARAEMATNYFGTLAMCRAFTPVLGSNGGGAIVNMLSVLSFISLPHLSAGYCASKAAAWSMTNALRVELSRQQTQVVAVHAGYIDTDMAQGINEPKIAPELVAAGAFDALEAGLMEYLADDTSRGVKSALANDLSALYPPIQHQWNTWFGSMSPATP